MVAESDRDQDQNADSVSEEPEGEISGDERKRISEEELHYVFEQHQIWLFTNSREGEKAGLEGITLALSDQPTPKLHKRDLREADLRNIDFAGADLAGADLRGCNLTGADFGQANLKDTKLQGAILEDAKLDLAENLLPGQLAGAVLSCAKLPASLDDFKSVEQANKVAKLGRSLFFLMLAASLFSIFVVATTPDIELIAGQASETLPLIDFDLPIVAFIRVAPLFILALYFYLNFYLIIFFEEISSLPAVFPDGRNLDQHVEPWIITSLIYVHMCHLRERKPNFLWLRKWAAIFIAWFIAPIFFLFVWASYIKAHEIMTSTWHAILFIISLLLGVIAYRIGRAELRGETSPASIQSKYSYHLNKYRIVTSAIIMLTLMYSVSYLLMKTPPLNEIPIIARYFFALTNFRTVKDIDRWRFLTVSDSEISNKPENWRDPFEDAESKRENSVNNRTNLHKNHNVFGTIAECDDYPPSHRFLKFLDNPSSEEHGAVRRAVQFSQVTAYDMA